MAPPHDIQCDGVLFYRYRSIEAFLCVICFGLTDNLFIFVPKI